MERVLYSQLHCFWLLFDEPEQTVASPRLFALHALGFSPPTLHWQLEPVYCLLAKFWITKDDRFEFTDPGSFVLAILIAGAWKYKNDAIHCSSSLIVPLPP
jgi:hypothetical protein